MNILITGATGFVGRPLIASLIEKTNARLILAVRQHWTALEAFNHPRIHIHRIDSITAATDWKGVLEGINLVIHLAARVHVMNKSEDVAEAYYDLNVEGTLNLAKQAIDARVERFIFLSTVKVNGEYTRPGFPFKAEDIANPQDDYAKSKYLAEKGLMALAGTMEVVIIRPPLVYGPAVKGNFIRMIKLIEKGVPLPLGAIKHNRRSMVSVVNLVHFIITCLDLPQAANQVFLISDNEDVSTTVLFSKIKKILNKKTPLLPVPIWILNGVCLLLGKKKEIQRLSSSLQVDITKTQKLTDFQPVESLDEALTKTVTYVEQV